MKTQVVSFFTAILLVLFAPLYSAADQAQEKMNYTIGPEDVLEIWVLGQQELERTVEVSQDGTISFPLIGKVVAYGRTPFELEKDIARKLAEEKYLLDAQVSVEVKQYGSLKVYLLGEIKNPGRYFLKGRTHVFSILAEAGGLTDDAGSTVVLIRGNAGSDADQPVAGRGTIQPRKLKTAKGSQSAAGREIITVDLDDITLGKNPASSYVLPGDTIQVPAAPRFYVTGEVKKPGEFKWEKQLSVRRAIAMAGGATKAGATGRTTIQRFENGVEIEFQPQMTDMVKSKDIIIIPQSYF